MAGSAKYFGRRYRLSLFPPGEGKKPIVYEVKNGEPAMDIKFDVTYARGQTARDGTISILGLGHKTIHEYIRLAVMPRGQAMKHRMKVVLDVGYLSGGEMVEVLNGFAYYATVTSPPQMWLNIRVCEYDPLGEAAIQHCTPIPSLSRPSLSCYAILQQLCDRFAETEGIPFTVVDKTDKHEFTTDTAVATFAFPETKTVSGCIQKLNEDFRNKWQFVLRTHRSADARQIEVHNIESNKVAPGRHVIVDKDHGLLSVTGLDAVSGCITTFLDGGCPDELTHLDLKSQINQPANGTYYILRKQYVGHFMGPEWYTRYFCSDRKKDK